MSIADKGEYRRRERGSRHGTDVGATCPANPCSAVSVWVVSGRARAR